MVVPVCVAWVDVVLDVPVGFDPMSEMPKLDAPGVGVELLNEETLVGRSEAKGTTFPVNGAPCKTAGWVGMAGTGRTFEAL